jgi:hypothetical protein
MPIEGSNGSASVRDQRGGVITQDFEVSAALRRGGWRVPGTATRGDGGQALR